MIYTCLEAVLLNRVVLRNPSHYSGWRTQNCIQSSVSRYSPPFLNSSFPSRKPFLPHVKVCLTLRVRQHLSIRHLSIPTGVWKHLLRIRENNKRGVNQSNQATPSIWAWGKSSSGLRVVIMAAFPRIKLREYLWNRWEVAIDSS